MSGIDRAKRYSKRRRAQRGSAILFIMMMIIFTAVVVLFAAEFGQTGMRQEVRREDSEIAFATWEATVAQVDDDASTNNLTLPSTRAISMNGVTGTATIADNSSNLANSILITSTLTTPDQRTYPESSVISKYQSITPFDYAFFVNGALTSSGHNFSTGSSGSNGDVFANGNVSLNANGSGNTINGNLTSTGTISLTNLSVTGTQTHNGSAVTFGPLKSAATYSALASTTSSNNNLGNTTFSTVTSGNPYPILYCSAANINVGGTFTNPGTVYFAGNVTINNAISYGNGSSECAFIVAGNLTTNGQAFVGYWYVAGSVTSGGAGFTNSKGAVVTNSYISGANLNITLDPAVKNSPTTGALLHLPGYTWTN